MSVPFAAQSRELPLPYSMTMVVDGHTGVEHALPIARVQDDVA